MSARILIIAGSDSGGGAGIQADIKTVTKLGGFAMTAITAVTAQNTLGVQAVHPIPTEIVLAQLRSTIDDIGVDAIKIGMIGSAETAHAVADILEVLADLYDARDAILTIGHSDRARERNRRFAADISMTSKRLSLPIVFDPVMVSTSGDKLADAQTQAVFERFFKLATVVTPNLPELAALGGVDAIASYGCAVLAKGGHGDGAAIVDQLYLKKGLHVEELRSWTDARIDTLHTHGTGCTLASAIAVGLGQGLPMADAITRARAFVRAALLAAPGFGGGHGPMGHHLVDVAAL